jgi:hypothetical protein
MAAEANAAQAPPSAVQAALTALGTARPGLPLRMSIAYTARANAQATAHLWALAELDAQVVRQDEWLGGGTVDVTLTAADGTTLSSTRVPLPTGERAISVDLGEVTPPADGELW